MEGFTIFELLRKKNEGGGLLTAVSNDLHPVLTYDGDETNEILIVEAKIGKNQVCLFNGYGVQENESLEKKVEFFGKLEEEVIKAI